MIVLGGLGSVNGAVLGAIFVTALPLVFQQYAGQLPLVSEPGQGGVNAGQAARFLFGLAIVGVVLFEPAGLVGLGRHRRRKRPASSGSTPSPTPAQGSTA